MKEITEARALRATYSGQALNWRGVIRDETGRAVWTCEHAHRNRDTGSYANGGSARQCALVKLHEIDPQAARQQRGY